MSKAVMTEYEVALLCDLCAEKSKVIQLLEDQIKLLENGWYECKEDYEAMKQSNLLDQDKIDELEEKIRNLEDGLGGAVL